jgi:hypothetical protein
VFFFHFQVSKLFKEAMSGLLTKLGLPEKTTLAKYHLRLNDCIVVHDAETAALAKEVDDPSRFCEPGDGRYRNSFMVERRDSGEIHLTSLTIHDGAVVQNFAVLLSDDGRVLRGHVNVFFGLTAMDQAYIDELLEELVETPIEWDAIKYSVSGSPEF